MTKKTKTTTAYKDCPNTPNWVVCRASNNTEIFDVDGRALIFLTRRAAREHCWYAGEVVRQQGRKKNSALKDHLRNV